MKKKKAINGAHSTQMVSATSKADRAELKITIMVISTGITAVLAHLLEFIYYLPIASIQLTPTSTCFYVISAFIYVLAVGINFFFYLFFNHVFEETFLGLVNSFLGKLGLKKQGTSTSIPETQSSKVSKPVQPPIAKSAAS